jgi:hypothetical protein
MIMKNLSFKKHCLNACMALAIASGLLTSCKKTSIDPAAPNAKLPDNLSLSSLPVSPPPASISSGLVAYYTFENTVFDFSGNNHGGSLFGSISYANDRNGHARGAYGFDGTSAYITVADRASLRLANSDFTLNTWIRPTAYSASLYSTILSKRGTGANNGWFWAINGTGSSPAGAISYIPGVGNTGAVSTSTITTGAWHMVTSIYTKSTSQLSTYIDGTLSNTVSGISGTNASATALMYIGRDNPAVGTSYFKGAINDIRIYNRTISATEINALYIAPDAPMDGLIAYWPLCNTTWDCSPYRNTGTLQRDTGNSHYPTATSDRFGNPIGAYHFDGTGWISVPDTPSLRLASTNFTINAWIKEESRSPYFLATIISKRGAGARNGWFLGIHQDQTSIGGAVPYGPPGLTSWQPNIAGDYATGTTSIPIAQWHMVTILFSQPGGNASTYIDGVLDNVTGGLGGPNGLPTDEGYAHNTLFIGHDIFNLLPENFKGDINDVRIYNKALTATEVGQLYGALN